MTEEHEHTHYHGVDRAEQHLDVDQVLKILLKETNPTKIETVKAQDANGRVLGRDFKSPTNIPVRARSTRDGYAVNISTDTNAPQRFDIVGEVRIGSIPRLSVKPGQAARVATGSFLPDGASAVLMVEYAEAVNETLIATRPVSVGENILKMGEDIKRGQNLLPKGTRIFPHHIALFSMLGVGKLFVYSKPRIAFFSTGDELIDARRRSGEKTATGIFDVNRPFIASMISNLGAVPVDLGIAKDRFAEIKNRMVRGLKYDALILSAGSSVGERDYVSRAAESIPGVRMLVHGIAMRPSSPTGIASYRGKPFILLPGFPTSAMISFFVFAIPAILKLSGNAVTKPSTIKVRMAEEYSGRAGVTHFVRVRVSRTEGDFEASIVRPTEAHYSSWLSSANGIAIIGENGVARKGDRVDVFIIGAV